MNTVNLKRAAFFILFLVISASSYAQSPVGDRKERRERLQAARVGFITNRLNLNTDQSAAFWPVYNEYHQKRTELRKEMRKLKMNDYPQNASDAQIRKDLDQMLKVRQQETDLEKEYTGKMLKVVTPRQVAALYKAEQEFNGMMMDRLKDRRPGKRQE
jgi:Spy/CpxP family protein refolding chaperone